MPALINAIGRSTVSLQRVSAELVQKTAARNELAEERKEKWRVLENLQVDSGTVWGDGGH